MLNVLHIIYRDKFTATYINFMKDTMHKYNHVFIITGDKKTLSLDSYNNVFFIDTYRDITSKVIEKYYRDSDKIVISGVFGIQKYLVKLPDEILRKISLQFWGGDFYGYRDLHFSFKRSVWKKFISKYYLTKVIKKCNSLLFLIPADYFEYLKIMNIPKKHFIVPVPLPPNELEDYTCLENKIISNRILLGNSATIENQHKEALEIIKRIGSNIEIMCPLSYGDKLYGEKIIKYGMDLFGKRFIPLTEFYEKQEYINKIATCEIGVFNNNRQQALWNIYVMIAMGKKVFIRSDTPMWDWFKYLGVKVYDINDLKHGNNTELFGMSKMDRLNNMDIIRKIKKNDFVCWDAFFLQ